MRMTGLWCWREESNLRPTRYECVALPTELLQQDSSNYRGRIALNASCIPLPKTAAAWLLFH